jgi:hypothetical protein
MTEAVIGVIADDATFRLRLADNRNRHHVACRQHRHLRNHLRADPHHPVLAGDRRASWRCGRPELLDMRVIS